MKNELEKTVLIFEHCEVRRSKEDRVRGGGKEEEEEEDNFVKMLILTGSKVQILLGSDSKALCPIGGHIGGPIQGLQGGKAKFAGR